MALPIRKRHSGTIDAKSVVPVLFAPYFANLSDEYYYVTGYIVAAFYGLVLVSLDNIQEDLENPYDQVGTDDLNLDVADFYSKVLTNESES